MYTEIITLNNNQYQIWYESLELRQNAVEEAELLSTQTKETTKINSGHTSEHPKDRLLKNMGFQLESNGPPDSSKDVRKAFNMM